MGIETAAGKKNVKVVYIFVFINKVLPAVHPHANLPENSMQH